MTNIVIIMVDALITIIIIVDHATNNLTVAAVALINITAPDAIATARIILVCLVELLLSPGLTLPDLLQLLTTLGTTTLLMADTNIIVDCATNNILFIAAVAIIIVIGLVELLLWAGLTEPDLLLLLTTARITCGITTTLLVADTNIVRAVVHATNIFFAVAASTTI